jgi:NCAIR mutase (PurE)-related protein
MSRISRKIKEEGIDIYSVDPEQIGKKFNILMETIGEQEDSINEANEQLKQLFKNTNYEQVKFFKFMNEQIRKASETVAKHGKYFEEIMDLTTCCERTGKKSILDAIEDEIYPLVADKTERMVMSYLSEELKILVRKSDYKNDVTSL